MEFTDFWERTILEIGGQVVQQGPLVSAVLAILAFLLFWWLIGKRWLVRLFEIEAIPEDDQRRIRRLTQICLALIITLILLVGLGVDFAVDAASDYAILRLKVSIILKAALIYFGARLLDLAFSDLLTQRYQQRRAQQLKESGFQGLQEVEAPVRVSRIVQPIVYLAAAIFILSGLGINPKIFPFGNLKADSTGLVINLHDLLGAVLILFITRLAIWIFTELLLFPIYKRNSINVGSQYAINRLLTYLVFTLAIIGALQYVGVNLTVLTGGAAALLVGIGLGLQQTFNDLICGIILLFERTVEVGDMVDVNGLIGKVRKIGIRTSLVETMSNVSVIVPNSKLVGDNVVNWSHFDAKARFTVEVGVAYGSDTALVKQILLDVASEHKKIVRRPAPFVRFTNFGDSSLDFQILFWCRDLPNIEDVKSDLRFGIDAAFREHDVTIPFPQRDVWMR
ncbi:MAG: mechanosensitive ion channel domain-containing protein [Bacteroidota bacterium]